MLTTRTWGDGGKDGDLDYADHRVAEGYAVANSNSGHDNERPLCLYPERAVYSGPTDGENDRENWVARNFSCRR